jgi:hypothetical protein
MSISMSSPSLLPLPPSLDLDLDLFGDDNKQTLNGQTLALCAVCSQSGDDPYEYLAKFGKKLV